MTGSEGDSDGTGDGSDGSYGEGGGSYNGSSRGDGCGCGPILGGLGALVVVGFLLIKGCNSFFTHYDKVTRPHRISSENVGRLTYRDIERLTYEDTEKILNKIRENKRKYSQNNR